MIAIIVVIIIITTLAMDAESFLPRAPVRGFIRPPKTARVKIEAMTNDILTWFFTPLTNSNSTTPIITGMKAVKDGLSETEYPHMPIKIKVRAFMALIK
ncbi:MAG TPA: hypothetical protein GX724_08400 [Fibrobacter sp.]|nr:hypothetical protein [Fibrobacter sp.]